MGDNEQKMDTNVNKKTREIPNVPNLRFKEFLGEWVTTTLESLTKNEKKSFAGGPFGSDLKAEDYTLDGVPIIQLSNITEDYLNFNERLIFTSEKKADSLISNNAYPGDLIIAKMMPAGRCCIAQNLYNRYVLGSDAIRVNLDVKKCNKLFMREQINTQNIRKKITSKTAGSTRQRIGIPELKNLTLFSPSIEEQNKIGAFLLKLDTRIETQSKIIEKLQSQIIAISNIMVKAISQKISLGEICAFERKTAHQSSEGLSNGTYPFFTNEEETVKFFNSYDFNGEYIIANTGGKANFKYYNGKFATMSDCLIIKIKDASLTKFYSIVFSNLQKYIDYVGFEGSGLKHLNKDWLLKLQVPQYGKEAEIFIKMIDNLKEKLQKEKDILSAYKKQKAYLLSNMFI